MKNVSRVCSLKTPHIWHAHSKLVTCFYYCTKPTFKKLIIYSSLAERELGQELRAWLGNHDLVCASGHVTSNLTYIPVEAADGEDGS